MLIIIGAVIKMHNAFIVLTLLGIILFYAAYRRKDGTHIKGLKTAKQMFLNVLPLLILAFFIAGLIETTIPAQTITAWLGDEAGWKGFFIGPAIGALIQGGPFTFFPLFDTVFQDNVGIGTAVAMITGWGMINVGHLPYEFAFMGPRFVILKLSICIGIPPLTGLLTHLIFG